MPLCVYSSTTQNELCLLCPLCEPLFFLFSLFLSPSICGSLTPLFYLTNCRSMSLSGLSPSLSVTLSLCHLSLSLCHSVTVSPLSLCLSVSHTLCRCVTVSLCHLSVSLCLSLSLSVSVSGGFVDFWDVQKAAMQETEQKFKDILNQTQVVVVCLCGVVWCGVCVYVCIYCVCVCVCVWCVCVFCGVCVCMYCVCVCLSLSVCVCASECVSVLLFRSLSFSFSFFSPPEFKR